MTNPILYAAKIVGRGFLLGVRSCSCKDSPPEEHDSLQIHPRGGLWTSLESEQEKAD